MRLSSTVFVIAMTVPVLAFAQDPTPAPAPAPTESAPAPVAAPAVEVPAVAAPAMAAPAAAPLAPAVTWAFEALVDAHYMYNFTGDPKTQAPKLRNFDTMANSFTLNFVKLGAQADTDLVALRADIGAGHAAYVINSASLLFSGGVPTSPTAAPTSAEAGPLYNNGLLIEQAFATLKLSPALTLDFGRFVTTAGAEVIEANKNWLYSRSILFYGIPLLHTGARLNFQPTPVLKLQASLVNGWNNDPDGNSDKTFGFSAAITPPDTGFAAFLTTYIGKESGSDTTFLLDAVVTKDIGPLSVSANLDYFKLKDNNWFGIAAMGRYLVSDSFNFAGRLEYIKDKNVFINDPTGVTRLDTALYEVTLQGAYTVGKHYELRAEFRVDMSDKEIFQKGATTKKNQATGLLAALAYF